MEAPIMIRITAQDVVIIAMTTAHLQKVIYFKKNHNYDYQKSAGDFRNKTGNRTAAKIRITMQKLRFPPKKA